MTRQFTHAYICDDEHNMACIKNTTSFPNIWKVMQQRTNTGNIIIPALAALAKDLASPTDSTYRMMLLVCSSLPKYSIRSPQLISAIEPIDTKAPKPVSQNRL